MFLKSDRSSSARPGPVYTPRPRFPYVPGGRQHKRVRVEPLVRIAPVTTGPVNDGFSEGRSGLRVSPSPERFEPICGVNGKPLSRVAMPFNCQPPTSLAAAPLVLPSSACRAERQLIAAGNAGLSGDVQRRRPPVAPQIVAVQNHLRLVARLRAGQRRIHVQILRPGVVGAELQAWLRRCVTSICSAL